MPSRETGCRAGNRNEFRRSMEPRPRRRVSQSWLLRCLPDGGPRRPGGAARGNGARAVRFPQGKPAGPPRCRARGAGGISRCGCRGLGLRSERDGGGECRLAFPGVYFVGRDPGHEPHLRGLPQDRGFCGTALGRSRGDRRAALSLSRRGVCDRGGIACRLRPDAPGAHRSRHESDGLDPAAAPAGRGTRRTRYRHARGRRSRTRHGSAQPLRSRGRPGSALRRLCATSAVSCPAVGRR